MTEITDDFTGTENYAQRMEKLEAIHDALFGAGSFSSAATLGHVRANFNAFLPGNQIQNREVFASWLEKINDLNNTDIPILVAAQPLAWYDPSDLSTLYQDSAMTIPVTADGDPVGAMLDKSGHGLHMLQAGEPTTRPVYRTGGGLSWLDFDGVDDAMAVASFPLGGSDEITLAAAVHTQRNDLAGGILCELSAISSSTPGTASLVDPELGNTRTLWRSRGNINVTIVSAWPADPPPASVLVGLGKISTDLAQLRRNGAVVATSANDQGSGSFTTAPLYLGARAATTFPWSGALYGMLISGSIRNATDIATIEAYLASKSGVTL